MDAPHNSSQSCIPWRACQGHQDRDPQNVPRSPELQLEAAAIEGGLARDGGNSCSWR